MIQQEWDFKSPLVKCKEISFLDLFKAMKIICLVPSSLDRRCPGWVAQLVKELSRYAEAMGLILVQGTY